MYNDLIRKGLVAGLFAVFIMASTGSAQTIPCSGTPQTQLGNILYVGGPGNYTTIQAAINNATNGDTVFVNPGTYTENVDTKLKKITLMGADVATTFIQGPSAADPVVKIGTSNVNLTGFTLNGTTNQDVVRVTSLAENVFISDNLIQKGGYGIVLQITTSRVTITQNIIRNIGFIGIQLQTSTYNVISFNRIEDSAGQGIALSLSSNHNYIQNNSVVNNAKEGILLNGASCTENSITGNNVSSNEVGIRFNSAGSNTVRSNNIQKNTMEGMLLSLSSENSVTKNNFISNKRQVAFKLSSRNTWDANYWSNWIGFKLNGSFFQKLPKAVHGIVFFNLDWHPAQTPYNISGFP
jgi:parallel beta-helix repeat protein